MWHGPHVGEGICNGCEKYNVDVLVRLESKEWNSEERQGEEEKYLRKI